MAWILVIRNRLWQEWLGRRYGAPVDAVSSSLGLPVREGWWPSIDARGRLGGVRVRVSWTGGTRAHRVVVVVRRGLRRRSAVLRPDAGPEVIRARTEELATRLGR
jgi:hypothetical protein